MTAAERPLAALPAAPAGRAESLRWVLGSLCAGLGSLILVAPHRFSAPLFATAPLLRDVWGAAALFSGFALLAAAVLRPRRAWAVLAHLLAAATLLALGAAFAKSGIWVATAAYVLLAAGAAIASLLWADRSSGRPRDLFAVLMAAVATLNGVVLLALPAASRAPYFGPARTDLPALGGLMLAGGLLLGAAQLGRPRGRAFDVAAHLLAGAAFATFGLLVSARQQAWTALAVNCAYALAVASLPWADRPLAHLRSSPLRARLAFALAASNALALILTTAILSRQQERLVSAHAERWRGAGGEQALLAEVRRERDVAMLALLALLPLAVTAGVLLARRITRPLAGLARAAAALSDGGPLVPLEESAIAEVAQLAAAFTSLHRRLAERGAESARLAAELRARARELEQMDRRKDDFLAVLGHELRNPIGAIASSAQLLERMVPPESPQHLPTERIQRQVSHLLRLLEDLLDVSRISRGKVILRPTALDLREVVRHAVETCQPLLEAKGQELVLDLPAHPLTLIADAARLEQVLGNLLRNASDYTPEGGRIEVVAREDGFDAVVRVRDNGIGIPADLLPRVFDAFQQGEREHGGLGLGLTLVKSLVELHGGRVRARSEGPGTGSELEVLLPLAALAVNPEPAPTD